ncbi:MAG: hypothetical protein OHK0024_11880 [Thalassobaculales bacterium]
MIDAYVGLAIGVVVGVAGQLTLKLGAGGEGSFLAQLLRWQTILGLFFYGVAAFGYIYALRKLPVSVAFPSVSLSYVVVAVVAHYAFGEPLGWVQLAALAMIVGGVMLLNWG